MKSSCILPISTLIEAKFSGQPILLEYEKNFPHSIFSFSVINSIFCYVFNSCFSIEALFQHLPYSFHQLYQFCKYTLNSWRALGPNLERTKFKKLRISAVNENTKSNSELLRANEFTSIYTIRWVQEDVSIRHLVLPQTCAPIRRTLLFQFSLYCILIRSDFYKYLNDSIIKLQYRQYS